MQKHLLFAATAAIVCLATPAAISSALARPMTETDLATLKRLSAPAASPDGKWVVYQLRETDLDANKGRTDIWLLDLTRPGAEPIKLLASADKNESAPVFSADSQWIYFLSDQSGSSQIWRLRRGQKAMQVSAFKTDVAGFKISPDGKTFAVWGDIAKSCPTFGCTKDGDSSKPGPGTGREYDELLVRHWDAWETPGNYSRVFSFPLGADGTLAGEGKAMDGDLVGDSPSKPFGGGEEITWNSDSSGLAFTLRNADRDEAKSTNLDIYGASLKSDEVVNLTKDNKGTDTTPTASPDGRYLAWASMARATYEADRLVLKLMDLKSGKVTALTEKWDRSVGSLAWATAK